MQPPCSAWEALVGRASPLSQGDVTITRMGLPELWGRDHQSHKGQYLSLTHCSSQSPSARFYRLKFSDERAAPGTSHTGVAPTEGELQSTGTSVLVTQAHRGLPTREETLMPVVHQRK